MRAAPGVIAWRAAELQRGPGSVREESERGGPGVSLSGGDAAGEKGGSPGSRGALEAPSGRGGLFPGARAQYGSETRGFWKRAADAV